MSEPNRDDTPRTPEQLREAKSTFDPSTMAPKPDDPADASGKPRPQHAEVAEQQAIEQKAREAAKTREQRLIDVGRGEHTTGRMGKDSV